MLRTKRQQTHHLLSLMGHALVAGGQAFVQNCSVHGGRLAVDFDGCILQTQCAGSVMLKCLHLHNYAMTHACTHMPRLVVQVALVEVG